MAASNKCVTGYHAGGNLAQWHRRAVAWGTGGTRMGAGRPTKFGSAMRGTSAAAAQSLGPVEREVRARALQARWDQFSKEFAEQQRTGNLEVMTNLRGLMLAIKRDAARIGLALPDFPVGGPNHLADL